MVRLAAVPEDPATTNVLASPRPSPRARILRFLKFGVVGGSGVLVNLAIIYLFHGLLRGNLAFVAPVAVEVSTLSNYLLNRAWTWRDRDRSWWSLLSYHAVTLVGACIQLGVLFLGVEAFHLHYALASVLGVAIATLWNFLGTDRATFVEYTPERRAKHLRVLLYGVSLGVHLFLASVLAHDWDTFVFQKTVENFLGHGITPYATGAAKPDYVYFGVGLPLQPMWYAYPPLPLLLMSVTYSPVVFGLTSSPWLGRLLIKLPFVAANLGLAWLSYRMVMTSQHVDPDTRRSRALKLEAFLLFNPLFVFVATIWGMFETLLLAFLLLSAFAMRDKKWASAGAYWGAATLIKIFPLYLIPVLGVHLLRRGGFKATLRFFATGAVVFALVSLPFWIAQPSGFVEQVFRMHANRPPGRFSPIAFLYETLLGMSRSFPGMLPDDAGLVKVFSALSFSLTIVLLGLLALASLRHKATERALLLWSGLSLLGGLLVTKVVSEQYLLLPLALLAMALWHPEPMERIPTPRAMKRVLVHATTWVCIAALLDNVHFLLFLPDDVAQRVLGHSVPETILSLAQFFGLTAGELRAVLGVVGSIGLLVPLWFGLRLLARPVKDGLDVLLEGAHALAHHLAPRVNGARVVVLATVLLLATPAMAVGVMAPKRDAPPADAGLVEGPLFLVHYRTDWFNPTKRPEVAGGHWASSTLTPTSGYYNAVAHKIAEDVQVLQASGADAVVFTFDPAFEGQAAAGRLVAEEAHMPYALEVDLKHVALPTGGVPITTETAGQARELLNGPSFVFWRTGYHLRLAPGAGYLVFLQGAQRVAPTFTDAERKHVAEFYGGRTGARSTFSFGTSTTAPLWESAPRNAEELNAENGEGILWREAYRRATDDWWARASALGDNATRLDLVLDQDLALPLPAHSGLKVVGTYDPVGTSAVAAPGPGIRFGAANAQPSEIGRYPAVWADAVRARPRGILVPWNDFDAGMGVEPTLEYGAALLHLTQRWAESYRGTGADATALPPAAADAS